MRKRKSAGISRREFVSAAVAGACFAAVPGMSLSAARRPNVLFILADDLGYGDLSCFGRPDYTTPNLDRMAQQGVRFTARILPLLYARRRDALLSRGAIRPELLSGLRSRWHGKRI